MLIQIIEGITKVVELITNSEKLISQKKKRLVGRRLIELHEQLSRVTDNAVDIERHLKSILNISEMNIFSYQTTLRDLNDVLEAQAAELHHLDKLLSDHTMFQFVQIYDERTDSRNSLFRAMETLIDDKGSVIKTLCLLIERNDRGAYILPATFDLAGMFDLMPDGEFLKEQYLKYLGEDNFPRSARSFLNSEYARTQILSNGQLKIPFHFFCNYNQEIDIDTQEKFVSKIKMVTSNLLEQIVEANVSQSLLDAKNQLGALIRSKFTVEDLF